MTIQITIDVNHHFPPDDGSLARLLEAFMSQLSDRIAALGTTVDAAIARVQADVTQLKAQIADLQTKVDSGGASQAELDALASLQSKLDALDPTVPATLPAGGTDATTATPTEPAPPSA